MGRSMANHVEPLFLSHKTDSNTGLMVGGRISYSIFRNRIFKLAASSIMNRLVAMKSTLQFRPSSVRAL
jgi:hypothetical protein